ncbi:BQ5605_C007g04642 [Microbotryum silenes-dioicae]|uniref:BQ5605_C007g04642 protein n=1 Tax=Microbotryum silenes-dioicae TaxID=796604 RepID=A0A2X0P9Y4_9BASI|nr:BQ5605_C007g04642 [Microbotryum silenes-dioicae]
MTQVIIRPADRNRLRQRAMSVPNVFDVDANGPAKAGPSVPAPSAFKPRYTRRGGVARLCNRPSRLRTLMARALFGICVVYFLRIFFAFSGTNGDSSGGFGFGWGFLRRHLIGLPERSRASSGEGWTLEEYLDYYLPLNLTQEEKAAHILFSTSLETGVPPPPLPQPYHIWLTAVNRYSFVEARSLTHFWRLENEARAAAGDKIVHVVTLCSDPDCLRKCKKVEHEMLCYGGFALDVPEHWDALDWTKACGARDVLESGRNVLLGSELVLRKDPFPRLERYFPISDVIIAENVTGTDSGHLSTSLIWMRSVPETIELWYDVLERIANATLSHNLIETPEAGELTTPDAAAEVWTVLTLQEAFNEVLHSTELRVTDEFSEVRLRRNFNTGNGLRVHALGEEHPEIAAFNYLLDLEDINSLDDVYADASIILMPCVDGGGLRSFFAKYHGMWPDVGAYYSKPARSLRFKSMTGSRGALAIQLRIMLTLCKYTGRAFQLPETVTFTDSVDATLPVWRALPLSLIDGPMGIRIHEPGFDSHATKHRLKTEGVDDAVVEDRTEVELDIRYMIGVDEIIKRLKSSVYSNSPRVVLVGFEPNAAAPWRAWRGAGPVNRINLCRDLKLEPRCGEVCSGNSVHGRMPKKWPSLDKYLTPPKDDSAVSAGDFVEGGQAQSVLMIMRT